ncbi:uncharacterized protein LOC131939355 [Physella acuta]|uniref:uncharacterized protein LOC131939355 n=1 Tax=Physella acuta TaxID=109671 RepID=UPI0027DE5DCD|nr:uncharacterized protein LOC131939355 [Physella acuta]XP_059153620.1 uncharacterized protein LOC131939355 [Physella acuta]
MKSCLVLCREGYNAVVVVYTSDKEKEATSLIDILRENFAFNMNNIILIKTKYVHCREHKPLSNSTSNVAQMQDDCIEAESTVDFRGTKADLKFKDLFTNRYIGLQLPATEDNINHIFRFIDEMGKANSVSLFIKYDRTLTSNTILETVLRELSLLMETITKRKNKHQRETEQRFKLLQETWEKFVNYNVDNVCESDNNVLIEEDELEDMEDEREETGREFNKEALRQKQEVCEDVTYLIKCLHNVYFAAQQIERNEKILLPHVMKIFQNFHDWYVESIISKKDTVLDSNYKMRLFQKIEKRRHKTI